MSEPTAPTPAEVEATGTSVTVEYEGETFTLPPSADDWDMKVLALLRRQSTYAEGLELLLGPEQFDRFYRKFRTLGHVEPLLRAISQAYGFDDTGESEASSTS